MRYTCHFRVLLFAVVLAGSDALAQTKRVDEPPLVGTVIFSTSRSSNKLDINTASKRQLSALPGMTLYADKIIAGRPYSTKLDLVKRGVIPQTAYDKVKGRIIAHRAKISTPKVTGSATPARNNR